MVEYISEKAYKGKPQTWVSPQKQSTGLFSRPFLRFSIHRNFAHCDGQRKGTPSLWKPCRLLVKGGRKLYNRGQTTARNTGNIHANCFVCFFTVILLFLPAAARKAGNGFLLRAVFPPWLHTPRCHGIQSGHRFPVHTAILPSPIRQR